MEKTLALFTIILALVATKTFAQTELKRYKGGHSFEIGLPEYMSRTIGLNSAADIQYKSVVKDVYGFVIYDTKEDLALVEMNYSSIDEFYEGFIGDFLTGQENRSISNPEKKTIGEINFMESDATYFDKDAEVEIYYLVGIVETKTAFYKVLAWAAAENKDKFKADFQKILYSIKD